MSHSPKSNTQPEDEELVKLMAGFRNYIGESITLKPTKLGLIKLNESQFLEAIKAYGNECRVEAANHILLNCKERTYINEAGGYVEYISHNKIVKYVRELQPQSPERGN